MPIIYITGKPTLLNKNFILYDKFNKITKTNYLPFQKIEPPHAGAKHHFPQHLGKWLYPGNKTFKNIITEAVTSLDLAAERRPVIPLTWQLVQLLRVEAEKDVQDGLIGHSDPPLELVIHSHSGPGPSI